MREPDDLGIDANAHQWQAGLPPKPWRVADSCRSLAVVGTLMPLGSGTGSGCPVVSGSLLGALGEDLFVGDGWEHLAAAVAALVVVGVDEAGDVSAGLVL